ncbi:MAG: S26 family signal peptidase, partial [Planctomycetales bacterium]|nr:S26 family signal peptidase [Planctomycetales bacterium]
AELRAVAQPVHTTRHRPHSDSDLPARWRAADPATGWRTHDAGFEYTAAEAPGAAAADSDWLVYHHWRCVGPTRRTEDAAILDNYGYNQGLSRQLNHVHDVLLRAAVTFADRGALRVRLVEGDDGPVVVFDATENVVQLWRQSTLLAEGPTSAPLVGDQVTLEAAVCDGRWLIGVNGQEALALDDAALVSDASPAVGPAIAQTGGATVAWLEIWRDVHYLAPHAQADDWAAPLPLAADAYFLLGDNAPIALDSRQYGGVRAADLLGVVHVAP